MTGANVLLLAVEVYKIGQERVPIPRRRLVGAHALGKVTKQGHVMRKLAQVFTHIIAVKHFFFHFGMLSLSINVFDYS